MFTFLAISGQEVAAQTDLSAVCDQSLEACRSYCVGTSCESQCKDAFDACGTRVRVMKWLKSERLLDTMIMKESLEDLCTDCQEFCGGIEVPNCLLKCKSVCEGTSDIRRNNNEATFLSRAK